MLRFYLFGFFAISVSIYTYIHVHTCIPIYIHTYIHTYMHKYIHTFAAVCVSGKWAGYVTGSSGWFGGCSQCPFSTSERVVAIEEEEEADPLQHTRRRGNCTQRMTDRQTD
jgi:hypothetical protein